MFLELKRDGKIKGRSVAGENKQRDLIREEEASSTTVATDGVLLSYVIDAHEYRDITTIDIPNALIQTSVEKIEDMATIILLGALVDVLVEIVPDIYGPYVSTDKKGIKTLILRFHNATYGTMVASLLYYKQIFKTIKHLGFKINPYDPCAANRTIDDNQRTVCWHVDDCKISHVNSKFNNKLIKLLKQEYESIFEDVTGKMTVNRGKKHKYLGMTLNYSEKGACQITMFENLKSILETFEKIDTKEKGTKKSVAPANLFTVQEDCKKLDKELLKY